VRDSVFTGWLSHPEPHPVLKGAPGPSPWYLRGAPAVTLGARRFHWRDLSDVPDAIGMMALVTGRDQAVLIFDFGCYVAQLRGARLLVWTLRHKSPEGQPLIVPVFRFTIYDFEAPTLFPDLEAAAREVRVSGVGFGAATAPLAEHDVPATLPEGTFHSTWPPAFHERDEILVLSSVKGGDLALWSVRPARGVVDVYPQDWFNHGSYDFSYEWVTRVARVPGTRQVVGEGIRLPPFTLDDTLKRLAVSI
jgi:hypothetical protein